MAILAECDICGAQHRVKDAWIGQVVHCKDCGVSMSVPADQFITPEAYFEENGRLSRRKPLPDAGYGPWFVAIIVTVAVAGILFGVIRLLSIVVADRRGLTPSPGLNCLSSFNLKSETDLTDAFGGRENVVNGEIASI